MNLVKIIFIITGITMILKSALENDVDIIGILILIIGIGLETI